MALTVKEYQDLLKKHKTIAGVARATGRNERSLRRWVNKHVVNEDGPAVMTTGADSAVTDINAVVLKALNKNTVSREELAEKLNITPRILSAVIEDIEEQGHVLEEIDGVVRVSKRVALRGENRHDETWSGEEIIRFGVVADTHLCNKYQQLTHLNAVYDIFAQEGISTVYHVGDIVDGYYRNRPGHVYELFRIGADEQADYVTEVYPRREGITTKFITGNHDHTHIINGGTNIGVKIANSRDDMVYLGMSNAKVNITPNCILEINHPEDGSQYALSYSLQKTIDAMMGGEKPNIFLNGHHHKLFYMIYRNIHAYECGTFEEQTPFMRGKKLAAHVGGLIIEAHVDEEGTVIRCKNEFIPFYKMIKDDY